ncbi:cupin domain-containing protein [Olivibacter sp. SDN3]|uniref:cupin domain-containing protein n=1 Tax=Olivibacter sp. SDN3 TaxID=2764720 RepID=UPI00351AD351
MQEESFEILGGKLGLLVNGGKIELRPGESYVLLRNTIHTFYNAGDTPFTTRTVFRPFLHMDWLTSEMILGKA